jgi:serine/threonine-protein kinase
VRVLRALLALGLAVLIAFSRPHDLQARIGGLLLAEVGLFGLYFLNQGTGMQGALRDLPLPLYLLARAPVASPGGALLFAFAAIFPRPFFKTAWGAALVWIPQVATMAMRAYYHIYLETQFVQIPAWVKPIGAIYFFGAIAVFFANYRRLTDRNERRRAQIVAIGTALLVLAVLPYIAMLSPGAPVAALESVFLSPAMFVSFNVLSMAFPLSIAYAVLRHRAFDISVVIRQGLKYAVARRTLLAVLPLFGAALAGDLLMHRDQPLGVILQDRGWIYGALAAAAILAHRRQRAWLDALDRRFFREQYDARRLLREVAEQVREATDFEQAAQHVAEQIETSLHTEFAAVLLRRQGQSSYVVSGVAPAGASPVALPAESKLVNLIRLLGKPVELTLTETGWLKQQLPHEETQFLRKSRIEWLFPIASSAGAADALLAVGFKRSEEPYTREDQDLLLAVAASLSMLLQRPSEPRVPAGAFEECSSCGSLFDEGARRCSLDGTALNPVRLPRHLAGRYQLSRRQGGGGMGTVYEATDTELERRVAVKVMREDLASHPGAAERFRREARIAAAFSHPNVVTVHDFGVAGDSRAYLVMEFLEGVDLRGELKQKRRLAPRAVVEVLQGVCAALEAAHRRELTHRDIKPENIFLARSGRIEIPKVLDFGVAKLISSSTPTQSITETGPGQLIGTLRYMSPEQLRGEPATSAADLWALAVVAYEMLAGEYPFEGANTAEWHTAVMAGRFAPLSRHLEQPPDTWTAFFGRALAPDPGQRPGEASTFHRELEDALSA